MSDRGLQFRFGVSLVLALVCGNAALASRPLFPGQQYEVGNGPITVAADDLAIIDELFPALRTP